MPNLTNAKKALRQAVKRTVRNQLVRDEMHSLRRHFKQAIEKADVKTAVELAKSLTSKFDKAAEKNVIKKGTAGRLKSRMMGAIKRISAKVEK